MASAGAKSGLRRRAALKHPSRFSPLIALTSGEPAGIGPDICARLALEELDARLVVLADPGLVAARARALDLALELDLLDELESARPHEAGRLQLLPVELRAPAEAGQLDSANARPVLEMIEIAAAACMNRLADAMVTAPVHKGVLNAAGVTFPGHTEYLGALTGASRPVMLLAGPRLKVALATTHLPLADVPAAITAEGLRATIRIVASDLEHRFGVPNPRILVLGLNPHAGEGGVLGREEVETMAPVIAGLAAEGLAVSGPVSADSAFTSESLATCDVVLAMYHDQGLPVLKALDFGETVNVTLGLPIVRTSVDHGTALALAGTGRASHTSLGAAVGLAIELARAAAA